MSRTKIAQPTQTPTNEELLGEEVKPFLKPLPFCEDPNNYPTLGQRIFFYINDPMEDVLIGHPGVVTKVNRNGSISAQVFFENCILAYHKIPLAKYKQAGYYTI